MTRWMADAWTIARKDLVLELRSRERIVAMLTFTVLVAVIFSFSLGPAVRAQDVAPAMIWVTIIFAGMLGLGRSFSLEKEEDALAGLLLAPVSREAVFVGKLAANFILLIVVVAAVFFAFALFFPISFRGAWVAGGAVVVLACIGFMTLGTFFSAITAHTRLGDTLLPVLLLPLLIPVVIFAAGATERLMAGRPASEIQGPLQMLLAFDLVFLFVCTVLFAFVVEE